MLVLDAAEDRMTKIMSPLSSALVATKDKMMKIMSPLSLVLDVA